MADSNKFVRYEQAPIQLLANSNTCNALATTVTVGENLPLQAVRALGYNGAVAVAANGPAEGSFSVTYHMITKKSSGSMCSGSGVTAPTGCGEFYDGTAAAFGFGKQIELKIATKSLFSQGMINSFNITAEPNAIITATASGNFYDGRIQLDGGAIDPVAATDVTSPDLAVAHGSTSGFGEDGVSGLGFSCDPFTATYEASRGFTPIYTLGSINALFVMITDPQQSITLQGNNLPNGLKSDEPNCLDTIDASFQVSDICGEEIAAFDVCGFPTSRDIEVAENDILRGNITVVDYAFLQDVQNVSCS